MVNYKLCDIGLETVDCRLRQWSVVRCQSSIVRCPLSVPLTIYYSLFTIHYLPFSLYPSQFPIPHSLFPIPYSDNIGNRAFHSSEEEQAAHQHNDHRAGRGCQQQAWRLTLSSQRPAKPFD